MKMESEVIVSFVRGATFRKIHKPTDCRARSRVSVRVITRAGMGSMYQSLQPSEPTALQVTCANDSGNRTDPGFGNADRKHDLQGWQHVIPRCDEGPLRANSH